MVGFNAKNNFTRAIAAVTEGVKNMRGLGETISKQNYEQGGLDMLISLVKEGLLNLREASRKANLTNTHRQACGVV